MTQEMRIYAAMGGYHPLSCRCRHCRYMWRLAVRILKMKVGGSPHDR